MRFEDQSPAGDQPGAGAPPPPPPPPVPAEPGIRPRRRSPRSWSTPASTPGGASPRFDRSLGDDDWSFQGRRSAGEPGAVDAPPPPVAPPLTAPPPPPGAVSVDLGPVLAELRALRGEVQQLRATVSAGGADQASTMVTGPELAASIEALGSTLGNGMATLLTEHRNLLARDVDAAAERILEEVAQRLRGSGSQTADAVEERLRLVTAKALGDLSEQVHLRLDQLQTDVSGLRAVMLELPDQTAVSERLDHVVEAVGSVRSLTTEIAALRRRVSVRGDSRGEGAELSDAQLGDLADRVADRLRPAVTPAEDAPAPAPAPAHAKRPARRKPSSTER